MNEAKEDNQLSAYHCLVCGSSELLFFYNVMDVPASCNRLWKNKSDAINCPKGDIKLAFCRSCTFVSNMAIDPEKNHYDAGYDNSLFYSAHFQDFAKKLASTLVEQYGLYGKNIVEIGGGKVDFLTLLVELGKNFGFRFDPFHSKIEDINQKTISSKDSVSRSFPFLGEEKKIDFVFSYHELEHMNDPKTFLKYLRTMLDQSASVRVFFSVPNALKAFEEGDYSDVIYEHVSYFTIQSLYYLFSSCGFKVSNVKETKGEIFDSYHIDATSKHSKIKNLKPTPAMKYNQIEKIILNFSEKTLFNFKERSQQITRLLNEGKRMVVWGAGARGVTFLNIFRDQRIEYAVDINPHKHGMYIPGTGQKIVPPEYLQEYRPDFIILANPAYGKEIERIVNSLKIVTEYFLI
jgi:hypothetical protein